LLCLPEKVDGSRSCFPFERVEKICSAVLAFGVCLLHEPLKQEKPGS
jgi:hypothetical protein